MIKRRILVLCVAAAVAMLSSAGRADPACTASFTRDGAGTFPGSVKFDAAQKLLTVDLTVALLNAPQESCTVDLTPRRCQQFKAKPGQSFQWTLAGTPDGKALQSGTTKADKWGLVTVEGLKLGKDHRRLSIRTAR